MRDTTGFLQRFKCCVVRHAAFVAVCLGVGTTGTHRAVFAQGLSPARVARLTFTEGYVYVDRTGNTAGDPAQLNMPLTEGQTVVTGDDGQAEIEFEDGSLARLTPNTTLNLQHLIVDGGGSSSTRLGLVKGLAYFELRSGSRFAYTVDAGGDLISPTENTSFRINLDEPPAAIAVLDGTAHVQREDHYRTDLHAGETFRSDTEDPSRYFLTQEVAADTWDQWNEARDQAAANAASTQTAARDGFAGYQGYGWSDLDVNGNWYNVPGQGQVWQPIGGDDVSFDPYGNGSWLWYPGTGYTWASGYSWGWTPFRCGGWSYWNTFGWGWSPNAACSGFGFAGYGGYGYGGYGTGGYNGGYVNIVRPPLHYAGQRLPVMEPSGVHPIIHVHGMTAGPTPGIPTGTTPGGSIGFRAAVPAPSPHPSPIQLPGSRHIAGIVAIPLTSVGQAYTPRGGSAIGASLRRDFPVDRTTHTAVLGLQPTHSVVQTGFASGSIPGPRRGVQSYEAGRPGAVRPAAPQTFSAPRQGIQQLGVQQPGVQESMRPYNQQGVQHGLRPMNQPGMNQPGARPGFQQPGQGGGGSYARPGGQPMAPSAPRPSAPSQLPPSTPHSTFSVPAAPASSAGAMHATPLNGGGAKR